MRVEIDIAAAEAGLQLLEAGVVQAVGLAVRDAIRAAEESAKSTVLFRDKTGTTRGSIRGEYQGGGRGFVIAGGVSRLLESGTRPHMIHGRPILRFVIAGTVFYRRFVHHPGTAPRPFLTEAAARGEWAAHAAAEFYIEEAIRRAR